MKNICKMPRINEMNVNSHFSEVDVRGTPISYHSINSDHIWWNSDQLWALFIDLSSIIHRVWQCCNCYLRVQIQLFLHDKVVRMRMISETTNTMGVEKFRWGQNFSLYGSLYFK